MRALIEEGFKAVESGEDVGDEGLEAGIFWSVQNKIRARVGEEEREQGEQS